MENYDDKYNEEGGAGAGVMTPYSTQHN